MANAARTPVVIVAGLAAAAADDVATALLGVHTAVVHHDLAELGRGVLIRRIRRGDNDDTTAVQLGHGCVSCTLREELLPVLRTLATAAGVHRIVLHLHPAMEPETVCWALQRMVIDGSPVNEFVTVEAVVTVLGAECWLADAIGEQRLAQHGLAAGPEDGPTMAQLAVGQVEFADAVVVAGAAADMDTARRIDAVLDRLVPVMPRVRAARLDVEALLAAVPPSSRKGRVDDAHAVLTHHLHPSTEEHGVGTVFFHARRPFHPGRLHDALQILLNGVVRVRGRMWVATRPDDALALESAGGGLRIAHAGRWLGAVPDWSSVNVERALMASLRWDDQFEDREQAIVAIYHAADPQGHHRHAGVRPGHRRRAGGRRRRVAHLVGSLRLLPHRTLRPVRARRRRRRRDTTTQWMTAVSACFRSGGGISRPDRRCPARVACRSRTGARRR